MTIQSLDNQRMVAQLQKERDTERRKARTTQKFPSMGRFVLSGLSLTILLLWTLIVLLPLAVLVLVAFKSPTDLVFDPLGWPKQFLWSNFVQAWEQSGMAQAMLNSVLITVLTLLGLIIIGSMAAYPLARQGKRGWYKGIYTYFVIGLIVPTQMVIIPLYGQVRAFGLINTYTGIVLLDIAGSLPFVIFLYTGFIQSIPRELDEAALIDGAGTFNAFWRVVFPLLLPVTATVVITSGLGIWNDFFGPLLFLQDPTMKTLPLAVYSFVGAYSNNWGLIFSSIIISALPMIFLFFFLQRYYISGIASGAIKG